jgi:hypothetical protein
MSSSDENPPKRRRIPSTAGSRLPIAAETIMGCIRDPLKRGSSAKAFDRSYPKLEPVLIALVKLGIGICASPKCSPRLISKLQVIADFASSVGSTNNVIRRELSRNTFNTVTIHCG